MKECPNCGYKVPSVRTEHLGTFVYCGNCGMQGPKTLSPSPSVAIRLWDELPRRIDNFARVCIPEVGNEQTRARILEPANPFIFLGKPFSYWIELDSYAKANMYDKLIERNVSLDNRVLVLEAKVAHQEELERVRAMQWRI